MIRSYDKNIKEIIKTDNPPIIKTKVKENATVLNETMK